MQEHGFVVEMLPLKEDGQVDVAQMKVNASRRYHS